MKISKEQLQEIIKEEIANSLKEEASMTRQHYQFIADILRKNKDGGSWETIVNDFTAALANTNPKFNEKIFLAACGQTFSDVHRVDWDPEKETHVRTPVGHKPSRLQRR